MADFTAFFAAYDGTLNGDGLNPFIDVTEESETLSSPDGDFDVGETFTRTVTVDPPVVPISTTLEIDFRYVGAVELDGVQYPTFFSDDVAISGLYPDGIYAVGVSADTVPLPEPPPAIDIANTLQEIPFIICFLAGTAIATPTGTAAVETLLVGDEIITADGRSVTVKWVGRQTVSTRFGPAVRTPPVCISEGALGNGLPHRDLRLTADHALMIDGLLVNAGALVNGTTITFEPLDRFDGSYTVYHVETEAHDVILAEGTPAETFIDYVGRKFFDNYGDYLLLYGEDHVLPEMVHPRITSARMLPSALRARFGLDRAA